MSVTLDATLSAEFGNSYVDVTYADSYWTQHYDATKAAKWQALSSSQKALLLVKACRLIETKRFVYDLDRRSNYSPVMRWDRSKGAVIEWPDDYRPVKAVYNQALQFPRNIDRNTTTGNTYIPEPVMWAQCEMAIHVLTFDDSAIAAQLKGIKSESVAVGDIKISSEYSDTAGTAKTMLSPEAYDLLRPYIISSQKTIRRA
jgi:hypothetical protein